ncbi:hypothetical protein [Archaeoglobus profundus]|uniref:Uncharacterized protein n=1 Tax=Archaeoglobus profundus (strain DSM 5631 / JCM 9629 / NBRC 100127 / Av18) TaxID=572546 RepID=D2RF24_ARCPA|nr:hypothetical protein [Archaeoglobus profundus]ADB58718.1 hypothetical protein Arcpr_1672 [Archaeoglobus profundus DSM 5631]
MRVVSNLKQDIKEIYGEKFEQLDFKFTVISKSYPFFISVVYKANCLSEIISLCKAVLDEEYLSPEEVKKLIKDAIIAQHSQLIDLAVDLEHQMNEIYYSQILPDLIEAGFLTRFTVPTYVWEEDEDEE